MYGERASSPPRRGRDMARAPAIGYPQGRIRPFCGVVRPLSLGRMTQVYDPCTHERPIWPPPFPTSPIQRAVAALIAGSIELAQVRTAHLRAIFAGPGGNLAVPHATGGRHIPIAGTVPRDGTGPREMNPKRE